MSGLKKLNIADIRTLNPCYDPVKYISESWSGTALDLLLMTEIPFTDVLWVITQKDYIDEGIKRRFAAWCAAEALFISNSTDKRSWQAVEAAIKFSLKLIAEKDLAAARAAAWDVAWDAAWDAARAAARDAAWDAAGAAARDAAGAAAWAAQRAKILSMLRGESDFTLSDLLNNYPIERT